MHYRLESIEHRQVPQACALCYRMHRTVVTFREINITVPDDPALPVEVSDGPSTLTVGSTCARKALAMLPVAYLAKAQQMLDAAHL